MVPGHEIIGRVVSIGPVITRFKHGDNVGVVCKVDSCQKCPACKWDLEQYCEKAKDSKRFIAILALDNQAHELFFNYNAGKVKELC